MPVFRDVDGLTVAVDVTNTGAVAGKEIVQVYVHDHEARLQHFQEYALTQPADDVWDLLLAQVKRLSGRPLTP